MCHLDSSAKTSFVPLHQCSANHAAKYKRRLVFLYWLIFIYIYYYFHTFIYCQCALYMQGVYIKKKKKDFKDKFKHEKVMVNNRRFTL
jgi:hypothetical protein